MRVPLIDIAALRGLLRYDAETGKLYWLPRTPSMFGATARTSEHHCALWNSQFAHQEAFTADSQGYRRGIIWGKSYLAHRVIWALCCGRWPVGQIDHRNGIRAGNHLSNLRDTDAGTNARNAKRRADNTSGVQGVSWNSRDRRWIASIRKDRVVYRLGSYRELADARRARSIAERNLGFDLTHGRAV